MYLQSLNLNNFRSFGQSEIPPCRDLTILVGENNGGKSNAIDAIRLLTAPLGGRRELYCEATDIRFGSAERKFELTATFAELSPAQHGRMISAATDAAISGCVFGLKYDETTGRFPVRPLLWAGHQKGNPEPGCHDMVRHVYLPPLRDAKRALASGNPTRIYALLNHFLEGEKPDALAKALRRGVESESRLTAARRGTCSKPETAAIRMRCSDPLAREACRAESRLTAARRGRRRNLSKQPFGQTAAIPQLGSASTVRDAARRHCSGAEQSAT